MSVSEKTRAEAARGEHRRRTLKKGRILLSSTSTIDCVIRDLTETGARLEFDALTVLPDRFRFHNATDGTTRDATLVWQRCETVGIAFSSPASRSSGRRSP